MGSRVLKNVCLVVVLVFAAGCDPETMVREKVPGWLQSLLGAPPRAARATGPEGQKAAAELKILSPKNNEVFPSGKPVIFTAEGRLDGGAPAGPNELVWKVKGRKIGNGFRVSRKFPVGRHEAELTLVLPGKKTITRKVGFSVANLLTGTVMFDGKGLSGTKVVLEAAGSLEVAAQTTTKKDGAFALEVPPKGAFRLVPRKEGFSFSPPSLNVQHATQHAPVQFAAAKGGITDIKLTAAEDSDTPLGNLCPEQTAYLKANIASETPLVRLQVLLIPTSASDASPIVLGEAIDRSEIPNSADPKAPKAMKVRVSEYLLKEEQVRYPFMLQLTAYDEKGNAFSAVAKDSVTIDMFACYDKWLADAAAQHAKGETEEAVETYGKLEKYKRLVPDISRVSGQLARCFFNKGLAYAELGVSSKKGGYKRAGYLGKAAHSFGRVLEYRANDPETMLLAGWMSYLKEDYQRAVDYLTEAIKLLPRSADAYQMRADAYVKTKQFGNLEKAVHDYTRALRVDSSRADLRRSRRETLKLEVKNAGKAPDAEVDISSVPFLDLEKKLKIKKYIRE